MRKVLSLFLIAVCVSWLTPLAAAGPKDTPAPQQPETAVRLSNKDVLDMVKAGLSPELVVAKIKTSATSFDTSATALQELKTAGVPDAVMLAMVQASTGHAAPQEVSPQPAGPVVEIKVPDGTPIEIELKNTVSGQDVKVGDIVDFTIIQPVQINGVTVFEKGSSARARITTAKKAGRWGKAGKLEWAMQDAQAVDGARVTARFTQKTLGDSKGGTVAVAAVATTVLLGPLGLLWGLKKGKPAIIPAGNRYTIFVHGDTAVRGRSMAAGVEQ